MSFEGWDEVKLGELIESVSVTHSLNDDKVIFLNTSDILEGKVLHHMYSPVKGLPGQAKKSIKKHDILFSEIRPANKRFAYIDFDADDYVVSTKLMVLRRISGRINNRFLYHILTSREMLDYLQGVAEARSGTFPQITFNELRKIKISLPPYNEQVGICNVIESIQGKIDLNNAINKNLEEKAQALFKRWFVDFEFPNENGEPYKSSGGEFEESEMGLIPKGWRVTLLGDIIEVNSGKRPSTREEQPNNEYSVPLIGASGIMGYVKELLYSAPIIITGRVGTLGIIQRFCQKCWPSDNTLVIQSNYYEFVYQHLKLVDFRSLNRGSTQPLVTQTDVKNLKVLLPDESLINSFENIASSFYALINKNNYENRQLENIRDTLLPKLMSGEIRVPVEQDHNAHDLPIAAESGAIYQP